MYGAKEVRTDHLEYYLDMALLGRVTVGLQFILHIPLLLYEHDLNLTRTWFRDKDSLMVVWKYCLLVTT